MGDHDGADGDEISRLQARIDVLEAKLLKLENSRARPRVSARDLLVKRLPDPSARILIWEAMQKEAAAAANRIISDGTMTTGVPFSAEELDRRLTAYEKHLGSLLPSVILGAAWGAKEHARVWSKALERLGNAQTDQNGLLVWLHLRRWPALYLMYAGGISAVAQQNWVGVRSLLIDPELVESQGSLPAAVALDPTTVLDPSAAQALPGYERHYTPVSDLLHSHVRPVLKADISDDGEYDLLFDQFEMMLGLLYMDSADRSWAPVGRFAWRRRYYPTGDPLERISLDAERHGAMWGPLQAGLFAGSQERFDEILGKYRTLISNQGARWF